MIRNIYYFSFVANIAVARSYLSAATKLSERTHAVSMVSLAQVIFYDFVYDIVQTALFLFA